MPPRGVIWLKRKRRDSSILNLSLGWPGPGRQLHFIFIALCLTAMVIWEKKSPGGSPRKGILGLDTTRGDRLFISLLGSAFIHLFWLALVGSVLWIATIICIGYAVVVFRYV